MFMASYEFTGDPDTLLAAHERMLSEFPAEDLLLHVATCSEHGMTVYDACPSREAFEAFRTSDEFAAALAGAGLPTPRITPIGDIRSTFVSSEVLQ